MQLLSAGPDRPLYLADAAPGRTLWLGRGLVYDGCSESSRGAGGFARAIRAANVGTTPRRHWHMEQRISPSEQRQPIISHSVSRESRPVRRTDREQPSQL